MTEIKVEVIGCGAVSQQSLRRGLAIQLKAIPDNRATFIRWEKMGEVLSTSSVCTVNPLVTNSVVAVFTRINFIDNNDGTISDTNTGLMWAAFRDSRAKNLREALDLTSDLSGFSDWRLPTGNELRTISPIDERFFREPTRGYYFSSSKKQSQGSSSYDCYELVTSAGMSDLIYADNHKEAYVRFVRREDGFAINFSLAGTGDGVVAKKLNDGLEYKNSEIEYYRKNSLIAISAMPNKGSKFKGWHGDIESDVATQIIRMDAEKSIVAEFEKVLYPLHLKIQGSGQGSINNSLQEKLYPQDALVNLQAIPNKGSQFKQWGGNIRGSNSEATIKMDGPKTVSAEFVQFFPFTASTTGSGTVLRSTQADEYEAGSQVKLNAIPVHGHRFVQWLGDATGTDPHCTLSIAGPHSVVAVFEAITYSLIFQVTGSGDGVISPDIALTEYPQNSEVRLTAKPATGARFKRWRGDVPGICDAEILININCNKTVIAEFEQLYSLTVLVEGEGAVRRSNEANYFEVGSSVALTAMPANGYRFVQWRGDAVGADPNFTLKIDGHKSVMAVFEMLTYSLICQVTGSGKGSITPSSTAELHPYGSIVTLHAAAETGSKFKQWSGDLRGTDVEARLTIHEAKTVTAEFVRVYSLTVSTQGKGLVKRSVNANEYEAGSTVTLTAIPEEGYEFVQWHEAAFGANPVCTVVMNSSSTVQAEFRPLPMFDLKVTHVGTGRGVVLPNNQAFWKGSEVELIAQAAEGCVFDGWGGDLVEGLEESRKVIVNAHLAVTAKFNRVEIPETDIAVVFESTTYGDAQNGSAIAFFFTVSNRSERQIHLDIPLAGFVTLRGEEIEQAAWVKGMIDGEKGATLRAGTFRKMGLVYDRRQLAQVALGEHLHITLLQRKPAQRLTFTFRCTNAFEQVLTLVKAGIEPLTTAHENSLDSGGLAAQAELTARMQLLEKSLQEALSRLNAPATPPPAAVPTQTLSEILAWLCTQNTVPVAVLRQKLLPLGLMPSAVLDDVNERAFDVAGEPALAEAADTVTVQRRVLLQVLADW